MQVNQHREFRLVRQGDEVLLAYEGGTETIPVRLAWARPITGKGGAVCIVDRQKNQLAMLPSLDALDPESRKVAQEELARRYLMPRITRVISATASFGVRYWHVETDLGERHFALKQASKNATWVSEDHLILRDTLGCLYEINPFSALDSRSRAEVDKVL